MCICLFILHALISVLFSLPIGAGDWLRLVIMVIPGLFYFHFCPSLSIRKFIIEDVTAFEIHCQCANIFDTLKPIIDFMTIHS